MTRLPLLDGTDRVAVAIERLRAFEPPEGYFLAFSGGKDSIVIKRLADLAGVRYEAHYHVTTVDPPELVRYIQRHHPDVVFDLPEQSMWEMIVAEGIPPLRQARYCCETLKESNGAGRLTVTGVRWAESVRRRKSHGVISTRRLVYNDDNDETRRLVEQCYRTSKTMLNPIIDWSNGEVWQFIRGEGLPYCELYDQGFDRLGCIGCPMASRQERVIQFKRWPRYYEAYLRAFARMLSARKERGLDTFGWQNADDVMAWWLNDNPAPRQCEGQIDLEG